MTSRACFLLFVVLRSVVGSTYVTLNADGGYEKVVLAISPEIDRSTAESLLFRLETLFTDASKLLLTSTRGRTYFQEIIFVLPKTLLPSVIKKDFQEGRQYLSNPDIFVSQDALFQNPYTVQHGRCGQPGLRIIIPQQFLFNVENINAQALVREWAHYRYGVFDESGFQNDVLYPAYYKVPGSEKQSQVTVSDCTNEDAIYEFRDKAGYLCEPGSAECSALPESEKNNFIVSSLMTKLNFTKVDQFCDGKSYRHNRNAPTKQNALCREKSTWDVISRHKDFQFRRTNTFSAVNPTPSFKYVMESEPKFILAVDSSKNMAINDRMDLVRNAFSYFVLHDLPRNSRAGVLDMKRWNQDPLFIPLQTQSDAERLVDAFPDVDEDATTCVYCGILKALQVLRLDSNHPTSSGTLLIATAVDITEQWVSNITDSLGHSDVTLYVIYFHNRPRYSRPLLDRLATSTGGRLFYIVEDFGDWSPLSPLTLVYESFRAVYESLTWMMTDNVLIDQRTFYPNSTTHTMSFNIDRSVQSFRVLLTGPGFFSGPYGPSGPLVKDRTVLNFGPDVYTPRHRAFSYKMKIPAYVFSIENPQEGTWDFTFERKFGFKKELIVLIRAANVQYNEIVNARAYVSTISNNAVSTRKMPFSIYAEVRMGQQPVTSAKVTAHVFQPETGNAYEMDLRDNGNGDPDVTGRDGIYSRYLTRITSRGYHLLTVVVESQLLEEFDNISSGNSDRNHCCGSFLPPEVAHRPGNFRRVVTSGGFFVDDVVRDHSPGRIVDLRVTNVRVLEHNEKHYTLQWTAPGADNDDGTVTFYELKVFRNRDDALDRFSSSEVLSIDQWRTHGPWLEPVAAGSIQSTIIQLGNITDGSYYIALRAVDSAAKVGDVSNVVEVHYTTPAYPWTSNQPLYSDTFTLSSDDGDESSSSATDGDANVMSSGVGLSVGIACGVIFLLLVVGIVMLVYLGRRRKGDKPNRLSVLNQNTPKTESNDTLCRSSGGVSIISPVSTWPAGSLLAHYETTQKAKRCDDVTPQSEAVDGLSIASTKYSYINRIDQNSSLYDSIYFQPSPEREDLNYPFNPSYVPFNPAYTSSLRRESQLDQFSVSARSYDYCNNSALSGSRPSRLRTDV